MIIDEKTIAYLEELSCLTLTGAEKARVTRDLAGILGYMARLGELDVSGVPERSHPFDDVNAFREDAVCASLERGLVLKNAPEHNGEMFIAPKTVD